MLNHWKDELNQQVLKQFGHKKGELISKKYYNAFPLTYSAQNQISAALQDIDYIEKLSDEHRLQINLYEQEGDVFPLHLKLYQYQAFIPLSDILPMLENMGLHTQRENPYQLMLDGKHSVWINDFVINYTNPQCLNIHEVEGNFEEAFIKICNGECENDGFNKLVLTAGLNWREITIIRSYAKYMQQMGIRFSPAYIEKTVENNALLARDLVNLFKLKFALKQNSSTKKQLKELKNKIKAELEAITSLDEDRIMRLYWHLIKASLRTNYFQTTSDGKAKEYLSIKLHSTEIPDLPLPKPLYEIFVYSPRFEGIHLRSAKVARGGLRWSDRREDFRTEILGLMKAQVVKNSVIIPSGAKGGFVLKMVPPGVSREILLKEVIFCYQSFIRGLLDLTDNLVNDQCVSPANTTCYDDNDPYLVVAADKGTASFSDIANGISAEYGFWLGDAFASGGSSGYDHKKIGITARGAWESVKRHFRELDINIENQDFTVVGVGDMSGDVFGNGMIYTPHIRLIAAFDHRHIFLDPNPDAIISYEERVRLFNLPLSSWEDYNPQLISTGGGVFRRSVKSIVLSPEVKEALGTQKNAMTPNELIQAILRAPVDLLFNGGIGTYVKASSESHADVGDKTNEFCRVNGNELRCRVVGEGGNLGCTQLGRIEYALQGGLINTDFIDNAAGVNCSDHEVNIKILLDKEIQKGHLTEKKRNQLLVKMTDEVAELVLNDNYNQALIMSISSLSAQRYGSLYQAYIKELESSGLLNRANEYLPDDKKMVERKAAGQCLTRPELAVLLAYSKIHLTQELLKSEISDDPYFIHCLESAFPARLAKLYPQSMCEHRLRREIVATQLSNQIVNVAGMTFIYRMSVETGASIPNIARAYSVSASIYDTHNLQYLIDSTNFKIPVQTQYDLMHQIRQLLNLSTHWFLRNNRLNGDIHQIIEHYGSSIKKLESLIPTLIVGVTKDYMQKIVNQFVEAGLAADMAQKIAIARPLYTALNVIEVSTQNKLNLTKTAEVYFQIGGRFNLVWFRDQIASDGREGHWNTMARLSLRDELDSLQRSLAIAILQSNIKENNASKLIDSWLEANTDIQKRWDMLLGMLHGSTSLDYTMFFIALRELSDLLRTS
ncbi:NAD-glutamate dehydrogenase [Legionella quinlivanii]|uniref:NAD-glutamate dehydrogenase n=1 Tax=Legionella quinlivanii TaxID=45073 RepID=UPI00224373F8|nr:NAD-glutamate dehydrogenase domain-containing protein [Legionella quinlivanii]MCW8451409.1 NAD-glutamate dehydrogenase [Legionella quinlivanii]